MAGNGTTRIRRYALYVLYAVLCTGIQYYTPRTEFVQLITLYGGLFAVYLLTIRTAGEQISAREIIFVGLAMRLLVLFAMPNLTDDHYRFIWDGQLTAHGENPYTLTPEQVRSKGFPEVKGINEGLYIQLNSVPYYTIYPPLCQGIFAIGAWLGGDNFSAQVIIIKFLLLLFEAGTLLMLPALLRALQINEHHSIWYALNPLIILEINGNMHLEGIMIFFLCAALLLWHRQKWIFSAICFGAAIAAKLWPLMLMPLFFRQLGWRASLRYSVIAGAAALFLLLPMLWQYANILGSLNLYFQQFEFNGSIFYLGKYFFDKDVNYEHFSSMRASLPFFTLISIMMLSAAYRKHYFITAMLLAFTLYLVFATTVHPWYLSPLIFLSVLSCMRYPILWSLLIYLSYYTYITPAYIENMTFVWIEYILVGGFAIYEFTRKPILNWDMRSIFKQP